MRHRRSIAPMLLALGLVLSAAGIAVAKGDEVVTLDEPLPTDPQPGSTISISWTVDSPDGNGRTVRFSADGVFVRFTPATGDPVEVVAQQDRDGHYHATVTVPPGGLGNPVFGLKGEMCSAGGGCERSDMFFRLATDTRHSAPDPVAAPVATVAPAPQVVEPPAPVAVTPTQTATSPVAATVDLTLLPLVALVGLAAAGFVLLIRGRRGTTAA